VAAAPILDIRSVRKSYGGEEAVAEASLALQAGSIICLLGPSGCGKSSLLRLVAGLEEPDQGEIEAAGQLVSGRGVSVPPEKRSIGMVFQDFALFPHLTAAQNVAFGIRHLPANVRRERAHRLLDQFKLAGRADAWPHTLSGGEQQRVAIARALAREPAVILLDEPFSGLDGDLKAEVRHAVVSGLRAANATVLMVTHDPEEAMLTGDQLALMSRGRILQRGTPRECYLSPSSLQAARLLGPVNLLPATVAGGTASTPLGMLPAPDIPDGPAQAMVRPEGLRFDPAGAPAQVVRVRFGGARWELVLRVADCELTMNITHRPPDCGGTVTIALNQERALVFPNQRHPDQGE
jgi:iron(III) transport system ATP-binding protein